MKNNRTVTDDGGDGFLEQHLAVGLRGAWQRAALNDSVSFRGAS